MRWVGADGNRREALAQVAKVCLDILTSGRQHEALALLAPVDEAGADQLLEVVRNRGLRHGKLRNDVAAGDLPLGLADALENCEPLRVGKDLAHFFELVAFRSHK